MYGLLRELLFALDTERSHSLVLASLRALEQSGMSRLMLGSPPRLEREILGLKFRNPVGLAAGLDKDGVAIAGLAALGFGFIEVGTVTPRPQPGSPKPRLFRLQADRALINRMGFNNLGVEHLVRQISAIRSRIADDCPIGVNIGKNRDTPLAEAARDYVQCARMVAGMADYITLNLSSPNTPGLRDLAKVEALSPLLAEVRNAIEGAGKRPPLLVKVSPDMAAEDQQALAAGLSAWGADGVIATNTTTSRPPSLVAQARVQTGGLSGAPLFARALDTVERLSPHLGGLPLIACGGVHDAEGARAMMHAGADLIQVYTGLIYEGPGVITRIVEGLRCGSN